MSHARSRTGTVNRRTRTALLLSLPLWLGVPAAADEPITLNDALAALAGRQSASHRLSILGTHLTAIVDGIDAEQLLLMGAGEPASPPMAVEALVARSAIREAWSFEMRQERFTRFRESRVRLVDLDTTVEGLPAISPNAPGNVLVHEPVVEETEFTPEGRRTLTNGLVLIASTSPLLPRTPEEWDFSTKDWPLITALAGPQNVSLTQQGDEISIALTSADGLLLGVHEFDASRGWRPIRSRTVRVADGAILTESRLGYSGPAAAWPSLIVTRRSTIDGNEIVCVVDCEWTVGEGALPPAALRIPPVHLTAVLDGAQPGFGYSEPPAWAVAEDGSRLPFALALILEHWGTTSEDADFTADGIVDASDLDWVMLVMTPPAEE